MIITIDGPGDSGKSTVAQLVASQLGYLYLNSGYLYRAFAYLLVHKGDVEPEMLAVITLGAIAQRISVDLVHYEVQDGAPQVWYGQENITPLLKSTPEIDTYSSYVSLNAEIRQLIVQYLRALARTQSVVIEGRDAGSVIFPQAPCKVFLTASLPARAERWVHLLAQRGVIMSLEDAERQLAARDERDATREIAPLVIPRDAIIIDSTHLTVTQVVKAIIAYHADRCQIGTNNTAN